MKAYVWTLRDRIKDLPERWSARWAHTPSWTSMSYHQGGSAKMVYDRLLRLNLETCSVQDIGNVATFLTGCWLSAKCDACERDQSGDVVVLEQEPDFDEDGGSTVLCLECVERVSALRRAC